MMRSGHLSEQAFGQGLPPASGWKLSMHPGRKPTYDHEWVSEIINQNNERGRLLIERDLEIASLQRKLADRG